MADRFTVLPELQQYLSGVPSRALTNIIWNYSFPDGDPALPTNPATVRRSLTFSKSAATDEASPLLEYNCYISNLDGTSENQITFPRGIS